MESDDDKKLATAVGCPSRTEQAGKAKVCAGCPGRQLCLGQSSAVDPDQMHIDIRMKAIRRKILVLSGKGGVGKSSVAVNLSIALGRLCGPRKVGILDLDICGPSVPKMLNVENMAIVNTEYGWIPLESPHSAIKVMSAASLIQTDATAIVWRGPRKTALIKRFLKDTFWGRLDYLIVDTPPGTSDEHLTIVKMLTKAKPEGAIIVTTPQEVALDTICKEVNFCRKMGLTILGAVENMSGYTCPCCLDNFSLFPGSGTDKLTKEYGIPILGKVPLDPNIVKCCEEGRNTFEESPDSPAAIAIMELARTISKR